jgi:hypothetical protein
MAEFNEWGIDGIIRMNPDGSGREVFARGIRNSVGMDFNPQDGILWFTDNQVDRMGDDIPPEELNRAPTAGLNFGFPWYSGGHIRTNEYKDETPPEGLVFPEIETPAHAADLGMIFYTSTNLPAKYRGGIFFAQRGSRDRTVPIGAGQLCPRSNPPARATRRKFSPKAGSTKRAPMTGVRWTWRNSPTARCSSPMISPGPYTGSPMKETGAPKYPYRQGQSYSLGTCGNALRRPASLEPMRSRHDERIAADDSHGGAHVRDPAILSLLARRRNLGRHDATFGRRRQRVCYPERIATDLPFRRRGSVRWACARR